MFLVLFEFPTEVWLKQTKRLFLVSEVSQNDTSFFFFLNFLLFQNSLFVLKWMPDFCKNMQS